VCQARLKAMRASGNGRFEHKTRCQVLAATALSTCPHPFHTRPGSGHSIVQLPSPVSQYMVYWAATRERSGRGTTKCTHWLASAFRGTSFLRLPRRTYSEVSKEWSGTAM
jgi:hypothetical protein